MRFTGAACGQHSRTLGRCCDSTRGLAFRPIRNLNLDNPETLRMPYGLAIAAGTLYAFLAIWWS